MSVPDLTRLLGQPTDDIVNDINDPANILQLLKRMAYVQTYGTSPIGQGLLTGIVTVTSTQAVQIAPSATTISLAIIQSDPDNLVNAVVKIGTATQQYITLERGKHMVLPIHDLSMIYAISTGADQTIAWLAV